MKTKALVTLAFALEIEEGLVVTLAREIDDSVYEAIKARFSPERAEFVSDMERAESVDWYGAVVSLRRASLRKDGAMMVIRTDAWHYRFYRFAKRTAMSLDAADYLAACKAYPNARVEVSR